MPTTITTLTAFFSGFSAALAGGAAVNLLGGVAGTLYGAGLAVGGFVASIGGIGTILAVASAGVSLLSQARPSQGSTPSIQTQVVSESVGYRRRAYGRVRAGGQKIFQGVKNQTSLFTKSGNNMTIVVALCDGPIDSIVEYYIDGKPVTVNESLEITTEGYEDGAVFDYKLGDDSQTTFADLLTDFGDQVDSTWRGNGIAMLLARFLCTNNVYTMIPSGAYTEPTAVVDSSKVYDPRSDTTYYNPNSALVLRDFLIQDAIHNGMNIPSSLIDDDDATFGFKAAANICDTDVGGPEGTTRNKWETHGWVDYSSGPSSTLKNILASFDAVLVLTENGKIGVSVGGVWTEPTVTLTDDNITSIKRTEGKYVQDRGTVIKSRYLSPAHGYVEQDAKEYQHANYSVLGRSVRSLDFIMAANHGQCRHLQKIAANRLNSDIAVEVQTHGYNRELRSQRFIRITSGAGDYGIDTTFEIQGEVKEVFDESGYCIGQSFAAIEMTEDDVTYDEVTEGVEPPEVIEDPDSDLTPDTPTLTVSVSGLIATCTISDSSSNYIHTIRYRTVESGPVYGNWIYVSLEPENYDTDIGLADGTTYQFEAKASTVSQLDSAYTSTQTYSTTADPTPPAACTSVDAATGSSAGEIDVTFTTPSSANFVVANVYTNTVDDSATATIQGAVSGANTTHNVTIASLSADDYYVYVASANGSGVESTRTPAASNPITVT